MKNLNNNEQVIQSKIGKSSEQTFLQRSENGQYVHEKTLNIFAIVEMQIKTT